jgi:protein-disulfide isomerase
LEEAFMSNGQVKLEVRPIAILGPESELAAQAAYAANDQGRFWEFHDMLYANQKGEGQGTFSLDNLKRMAAALGLDTNAFNAAMDSGKYESKVKADTAQASAAGVRSTPTVLVNGKSVQPTLEATRAAIEQELAAAR